ncbi:hypothetical protein HPB50_002061 [Hyalomma asiaticum]|uniref:Uncharacterized protein n=1 Tax=Hyalomma asiaticum TaxID=266040 RepID=A0ACB7T4X4_HYAAI|nr:hypothetical protein HPB50_002061 [Hyalomma asiaticum]
MPQPERKTLPSPSLLAAVRVLMEERLGHSRKAQTRSCRSPDWLGPGTLVARKDTQSRPGSSVAPARYVAFFGITASYSIRCFTASNRWDAVKHLIRHSLKDSGDSTVVSFRVAEMAAAAVALGAVELDQTLCLGLRLHQCLDPRLALRLSLRLTVRLALAVVLAESAAMVALVTAQAFVHHLRLRRFRFLNVPC